VANRKITIPDQAPDAVNPGRHAADGEAGRVGDGAPGLDEQVETLDGTEGHPGQIDEEMGRVLLEALAERGLQDREGAQVDLALHPQHNDLASSAEP
jgi:hypothetical protein